MRGPRDAGRRPGASIAERELAGALNAPSLYRRGKVADAVPAHAVTYGLIAAAVLATQRWSLWS